MKNAMEITVLSIVAIVAIFSLTSMSQHENSAMSNDLTGQAWWYPAGVYWGAAGQLQKAQPTLQCGQYCQKGSTACPTSCPCQPVTIYSPETGREEPKGGGWEVDGMMPKAPTQLSKYLYRCGGTPRYIYDDGPQEGFFDDGPTNSGLTPRW